MFCEIRMTPPFHCAIENKGQKFDYPANLQILSTEKPPLTHKKTEVVDIVFSSFRVEFFLFSPAQRLLSILWLFLSYHLCKYFVDDYGFSHSKENRKLFFAQIFFPSHNVWVDLKKARSSFHTNRLRIYKGISERKKQTSLRNLAQRITLRTPL